MADFVADSLVADLVADYCLPLEPQGEVVLRKIPCALSRITVSTATIYVEKSSHEWDLSGVAISTTTTKKRTRVCGAHFLYMLWHMSVSPNHYTLPFAHILKFIPPSNY